ncbi:thiamine phosphate synthase [Terrarubrum flagellatum]|uniref:thiamine phosphate synthase n=1 Tax=Terrirubrum flagellatum TaxID=2895980 RepID=UPI00314517C9
MILDRFYPIVESSSWVDRLTEAGARLIQLRVKDKETELVRSEIRASLALCAARGAQLIVNDYWRLAIEERADFIHLGQEDLEGADLKAIKAKGIRLGVSTHNHEELERGLSTEPDYVALGPIYPTILKKMPWAPQELDRIGEWKQLIGDLPLVAIGGITLERAPLCLAAGADSAAVVTDIVRAADPDARTREWIAATRASD